MTGESQAEKTRRKGGNTQAAPLVRLAGASVTRAGAPLLDGIDFCLHAGARWAVLGANGAGKTTLLRLLRGEIPPDVPPCVPPGISPNAAAPEVRVYDLPGQGGPQRTPLGLRQRLPLVSGDMQDLYARNEWAITGLDAVLTGFYDTALLYAAPTLEQRETAQALLTDLDLAHLTEQRVARMSTGQARSLLLARALVCNPDALFLDECLEGLDAPARAAFLAVLDRAAEAKPQLAMLFCSHRVSELPVCLTQALVLESGRIRMCGPLAEVLPDMLSYTLTDEERSAKTSNGVAGQQAHAPQPGSPVAASLCCPPAGPVTPPFAECAPLPPGDRLAPDGQLACERSQHDFLARITNADVTTDGATLLHAIDWTIRPGEHWAVLGRNGAGKTTLLNLLAAEIWPSALSGPPGRVEYGFAKPGETLDETRKRIGRVGAALDRDYGWDLRVDETVWSGAFGSIGLYAEAGPELREQTRRLLEFFGLTRLAGRAIRSLSRGQLRRVMLARALAGHEGRGPALLLLDEPMAGLDARGRKAARELFSRLAQAGLPLVMVTHHLRDLPEQVNRVLLLEAGSVAFCGTREAFEARQAVRTGRTAWALKS